MDKVVLTCALTGAQQGKEANPALPEQPAEIVAQGLEAWRAGAAVLHIHARDPAGRPTADVATFRRIVAGLREAGCDAILNLSTGGAVAGLPLADRLAVVTELQPEVASCSLGGACLLGRWSEAEGRWIGDRRVELFSTYGELERVLRLFSSHGVRPELEIYHAGMLSSVRALLARGALRPPLLVNFVLGIPGETTPCDVGELLHLVRGLPADARWLATAIGARHHFRLLGAVVAMGGHVRVGLEDNLYLAPGVVASANGQLVEKAVRILRELGAEPASPAEARALWGLPAGPGTPRPVLAREIGA